MRRSEGEKIKRWAQGTLYLKPYVMRLKTSITQKVQGLDDLKRQKVQDIGDPDYYNKLCYALSKIYLLGV